MRKTELNIFSDTNDSSSGNWKSSANRGKSDPRMAGWSAG